MRSRCLVGTTCLGQAGQAPGRTVGLEGQEWPLTSGLERLHLGEAVRGAGPALNPQALCKQAGLKVSPCGAFCSSWKPGPSREIQTWSWRQPQDRAVSGGPASRPPAGQASVWHHGPWPGRLWGARPFQLGVSGCNCKG